MIAVIGAGTMGKGIAIEFARFGNKVLLVSMERHLSPEALHQEVDRVVDKYGYPNRDNIVENITTTNELGHIDEADLVIEAVSENLEKKRNAITQVVSRIRKDAIIASNTSSLSIRSIFEGLTPLDRVMGMHFFNPVQVMKLVEMAILPETSMEKANHIRELLIGIEKEPVTVKDAPGFIVNRLLIPMINEAARLIDEGIASIEDIDKAMKFGANHPMGPLKLSDLIGNDITKAILDVLNSKGAAIRVSSTLQSLVDQKKLGRKTKSGFYDYK